MENSDVFVRGDNEVNEEKPPPRVCPRCNSDNTKFCYYNNYSVSQPRYNCKNCRRYWTHGGTLRNIPIGGSAREPKRTRIDQSSISQTVSVEIQQVNHRQPILHVHETNEFVGSFGGSSSSTAIAVKNHYRSFPDICGNTELPIQIFSPMNRLDTHVGSFQRDYYNVGSNGLIGNALINQSIGGSTVNSSNFNGYNNQEEDQNKWNQSFNNNINMNHNANTSRRRGSIGNDHMNNNNNRIKSNCIFKSSCHLEKHGP